MSTSVIVSIIVILFLIVFFLNGLRKGFLRVLLTTFSLVITLVLASLLSKPVSNFIENNTSIGPKVQTSIQEFVDGKLSDTVSTVKTKQDSFISSLPLPDSWKSSLIENNTLAEYADEGVSDFSEYVAVNLTSIVIKAASYVLLIILIYLILRIIMRASNFLNHIPILGGINRFLGAIVGLFEGVLFLWVIGFVIALLAGTELGITCQQVISDSSFLTFIYGHNYLTEIVALIIGLFKDKIFTTV